MPRHGHYERDRDLYGTFLAEADAAQDAYCDAAQDARQTDGGCVICGQPRHADGWRYCSELCADIDRDRGISSLPE